MVSRIQRPIVKPIDNPEPVAGGSSRGPPPCCLSSLRFPPLLSGWERAGAL